VRTTSCPVLHSTGPPVAGSSCDAVREIRNILSRIERDVEEVRRLLASVHVENNVNPGFDEPVVLVDSSREAALSSTLLRLRSVAPLLAKRNGRKTRYRELENSGGFAFGDPVDACPEGFCTYRSGYIIGHMLTQATVVFEPLSASLPDLITVTRHNYNIRRIT
jgi:hypothetical protein